MHQAKARMECSQIEQIYSYLQKDRTTRLRRSLLKSVMLSPLESYDELCSVSKGYHGVCNVDEG